MTDTDEVQRAPAAADANLRHGRYWSARTWAAILKMFPAQRWETPMERVQRERRDHDE